MLLGAFIVTTAWAAPGDAAVKQAQQAYAARKLADLERAARKIPSDHVLAPYVEYWRLTLDSRTEDARIADFLARYPGSRLAEVLRTDWLKSLGAREAWPAFLAEYPRLVKPDAALQCYAYRGEWAQGNRSHEREAVSLWFTGRDMPSACSPLFTQLIEAGLIGEEDIWRRFRLALEAGNLNVAKVVANALAEAQRPSGSLLDQATRDPARLLNAGTLDLARRSDREIALYVLDQLARRDSAQAEQALRKWAPQFNPMELRTAWARLATWAARRHELLALDWFQQAGSVAVNDAQREWWARAALRVGDWKVVQQAIDSMGEALRAQPVWRYWRARCRQVASTWPPTPFFWPCRMTTITTASLPRRNSGQSCRRRPPSTSRRAATTWPRSPASRELPVPWPYMNSACAPMPPRNGTGQSGVFRYAVIGGGRTRPAHGMV